MSEIRHVTAAAARRFLVLRHLLAPPRALPADRDSVLAVIDRLGSLQFDPLEVAGRNHDLVLLARIEGGLGIEEATAQYEEISLAQPPYPAWIATLGSGGIAAVWIGVGSS